MQFLQASSQSLHGDLFRSSLVVRHHALLLLNFYDLRTVSGIPDSLNFRKQKMICLRG